MYNKKQSNIKVVIGGLLLAILVAAMDNTIVTTALPSIVGELGGVDKFVWVTSAYLVAQMAGMPIFGKLSDMYGRKRFFIFGLVVFMIGSVLCGTADTINELIIYRAIQGIGGGALMPIAFTIMFDVVPLKHRGKMSGMFGAVFGISSVFGPLLGAYITEYIDWTWVFYINIPLGLIAFVMVAFFYKESLEHAKQKIDWLGAFTLVGAVVSLMFAVELGGKEFAWVSPQSFSLFASFAVLTIVFIIAERRAAEPVIDFNMFKERLFATSGLISIFSGAAFITASVYIPFYIQGVQGGNATNAGFVLLPMMVGSVVSASIGGALMTKFNYRSFLIPTLALLTVGMILLATLSVDTSKFMVVVFMILVGLGIGASFSVIPSAAIHPFSIRKRGAATSTVSFLRTFGMTIGITVFGIIQSQLFTRNLTESFGAEAAKFSGDSRALLSPEGRANIPAEITDQLIAALSSSISSTFFWAIVPAFLALLTAIWMSKEKLADKIE
ncbi:drug resistance transporter, EmrB/QacA subfamily protein [Planococcus donghaensis MPA1U2]|uniref:Drug resistance transporter, EmrB/QacA subfamily protein n=1 Tax=Planococcus donghaensis MPA1U2 TaxID=933115 RepID=E7REJ1_9BACL|nr:MDR family MFS transporter [Planococcus donghaensis]EGA90572.1 drug resistance transporter, EmrB/QacA subfamily protein [Planococcus donghaensis MPA1U2]